MTDDTRPDALAALREAATVVVTEYDRTHLTHDVAYEDVASAIDQLRLVLLGRPHPGLLPQYAARLTPAPVAESGEPETLRTYPYVDGSRSEARAQGTDAAGLEKAGRLAVDYLRRMEADWQEAKAPSETDDDLDADWVAFRDADLAAIRSEAPDGEREG